MGLIGILQRVFLSAGQEGGGWPIRVMGTHYRTRGALV